MIEQEYIHNFFPQSKDWSYYSEGGKHAVFCYQPQNNISKSNNASWSGLLLRIDKAAFRYCDWYSNNGTDATALNEFDSATTAITTSVDDDQFRNMIHTVLKPYVDIPHIVSLNWSYIHALRLVALSSGRIPSRRRNDWFVKQGDAKLYDCMNNTVLYKGNIIRDYRLSTKEYLTDSSADICIEIKPKCGFLPFSPFVDNDRTIKYQKSRYALLQDLLHSGRVTKDWINTTSNNSNTGIPFERSKYDPLDLFSGEETRIQNALHNLLQNPQNNLKIWHHNKLLFGFDKNDSTSSPSDWTAFRQAAGIPEALSTDDKCNVMQILVNLSTRVLVEELFLWKLLTLQKLDLLDTDGAVKVYHRLIKLCNGDEKEAESLVDSKIDWTSDNIDGFKVSPLLKHCPLQSPQDYSSLASLCMDIDATLALLRNRNMVQLPLEQLKDLRLRARLKVEKLSINECRYLLQAWLLSLTLCDLTFFINYSFVTSDGTYHMDQKFKADSTKLQLLSKQSCSTCGRVAFKLDDDKVGIVRYELKAIDVDRKPATKLRSRHVKDKLLGLY